MQQILSRPVAETDGGPARREARAEESRRRQWELLISAIGERYRPCRLSSFDLSTDRAVQQRQQHAIEKLTALSTNMRRHVEAGGNVILYGPPGTGKDHLLVAMLHCAIGRDFRVEWKNGQDLFGDFRDRIKSDRSEDSSIRRFEAPHVFAISDPVPPKGTTTDYTATMLYRLVDRRYRCLRSTWITANVSKAEEARAELSAPIYDRLADNCVAVFCNWPSFRQNRKPEWLR